MGLQRCSLFLRLTHHNTRAAALTAAEETMDTDQIKGKLQNAFGKTEEAVGKVIGSQNLSNAGTEDRLKGAATETWGNAKDTVHSVGTTAHTEAAVHEDRAAVQGESLRDRFAAGAEHLKDNINAKMDNVKDHEAVRRDEVRHNY
jgi:uncharacterized protein YjbJ (UPF0337 family)